MVVRVFLYDVSGRLVAWLRGQPYDMGFHCAAWEGLDPEGRRASGGIHFRRQDGEAAAAARKIIWLNE